MDKTDHVFNILAKPLHESTIERMNNWLKENAYKFGFILRYPEEFEKTPKKSIKRYLYQEAKG